MPLLFIRNDITKMKVDAIVNAAKNSLLGGGGVDGAIHAAAGPGLVRECAALGGCETGDAKITGGYKLPAKHVIHTVGPIYSDGTHGEAALLRSCYTRSLEVAAENGCTSVAFPLISAGAYGYPEREALDIAIDAIEHFPQIDDITVWMVLYGRSAFTLGRAHTEELRAYIDDNYVEEAESIYGRGPGRIESNFPFFHSARTEAVTEEADLEQKADAFDVFDAPDESCECIAPGGMPKPIETGSSDELSDAVGNSFANELPEPPMFEMPVPAQEQLETLNAPKKKPGRKERDVKTAGILGKKAKSSAGKKKAEDDLSRALADMDIGFSDYLLYLIDESGLKDSECYRRANISKQHFNKIKNEAGYRPKKQTAVAFAIALRLDETQTAELLKRAGYVLSNSSKFDIIIRYCIRHSIYDVMLVNELLFEHDQMLLGAS